MEYFAIGIIGTGVWMAFEIWRAPLMQENEDGSWTELKPTKKLFKRKNK